MRTEERISNYERQAEAARKLFLTYDQERILLRYDLAADRQWIFLTYLNVPCRISRESGQVEEQQEDGRWKRCDSFHTVMTVYDLLCYSRGEQSGCRNVCEALRSLFPGSYGGTEDSLCRDGRTDRKIHSRSRCYLSDSGDFLFSDAAAVLGGG